jgi:hypothetical protein
VPPRRSAKEISGLTAMCIRGSVVVSPDGDVARPRSPVDRPRSKSRPAETGKQGTPPNRGSRALGTPERCASLRGKHAGEERCALQYHGLASRSKWCLESKVVTVAAAA